MLELHGIPDEEHWRVVADDVKVAVAGVELHGESSRVAPRVRASPFARDGRKPDEHVRLRTRLEHSGTGKGADVARHPKYAERAATLRMRLPFRDPLAIEVGHLL